MIKEFDTLKIRYSEVDKHKFTIILVDDEDVAFSEELTSLDSARIHHVLSNIEQSLRYEVKYTTGQLSATEPLLVISESEVELYINRLEIHQRHDDDLEIDIFYFTFKSFDDIDHIKNYFAEAQY